ncbi:uncharacterized protein LOC123538267 [Mercenaria mercenaria]|uniref:uncharacterized protein LOC123538267 n=1 Tax=Mercenaria mercenaria TaxID=6596 RepID=UPI00234F214E|nr:uncharacterized protein LOC123538267 [Mercenaria mercenaria]
MTCVLSMPALYTNSFSEGDADIRNMGSESFDLNWITDQNLHSELSDNQRCATPCHLEASTSSSMSCRMEISDELSGNVKHEQLNVHTDEDFDTDIKPTESEKHFPINGNQRAINLFDMCKKADVFPDHIKNYGVKRKAEIRESEEVYIPPKRVSPFLNTPKERKDERKKILKISVKKIKQLDNPETYLRRTVLVNNTMKRLQTELRQQKRRTKKFTSSNRTPFRGYDLTNNDCMSDTYLFDDPFLSGIHEKITDDMTDTLINNVFHNKTNNESKESNVSEKSDIRPNQQEVPDTGKQACIDPRIFTSLNEDNSDNIPSSKNNTVIECNILTCLDNRTGTPEEMPVDRCYELEVVNRCIVNSCEENVRTICYDDSEIVNVGESDTRSKENIR